MNNSRRSHSHQNVLYTQQTYSFGPQHSREEHITSNSTSPSSYSGSVFNAGVMSRSASEDGSWQFVNANTPSPRVITTPHDERSMPFLLEDPPVVPTDNSMFMGVPFSEASGAGFWSSSLDEFSFPSSDESLNTSDAYSATSSTTVTAATGPHHPWATPAIDFSMTPLFVPLEHLTPLPMVTYGAMTSISMPHVSAPTHLNYSYGPTSPLIPDYTSLPMVIEDTTLSMAYHTRTLNPTHATGQSIFEATAAPQAWMEDRFEDDTTTAAPVNDIRTLSSPSPSSSESAHNEQKRIKAAKKRMAERTGKRRRSRPSPTSIQSSPPASGLFNTMSQPAYTLGQSSGQRTPARRGGREKGTFKLSPEKAMATRGMRQIKACWTCAVQRDKCSEGDICDRCSKRNANTNFGCVREKLPDFLPRLLPDAICNLHTPQRLANLGQRRILDWPGRLIRVNVTPIPYLPLPCELYEFVPTDPRLLKQQIFRMDESLKTYVMVEMIGPPIAFCHVGSETNSDKALRTYITRVADSPRAMLRFTQEALFKDLETDSHPKFLPELMQVLSCLSPTSDFEIKAIAQVNGLIVASYIMMREMLVPQEEQHKLRELRFSTFRPDSLHVTSLPLVAKRQMKFISLQVLLDMMNDVLKTLNSLLRSAKNTGSALSMARACLVCLYMMIGIGSSLEHMQVLLRSIIRLQVDDDNAENYSANAKLSSIMDEMDTGYDFFTHIFSCKFTQKWNPILNPELRTADSIGYDGQEMIESLSQVFHKHEEFILHRSQIDCHLGNSEKYWGRLVSGFLLHAYGLQSHS